MSSFDDNYASVLRDSILKIENLTRKYNGVVKENSRLKKRNEFLEENATEMAQKAADQAANAVKNEMQKVIDEKDKIIAELRSQLNNNSSNSGIPTSKTPISQKKKVPNTRKKTGRKKGGQMGHSKECLKKFNDDEIDYHIFHDDHPEVCDKCGGQLVFDSEECKDEYRVKVNVEKVRHHFMKFKCTRCGKTFKTYIPNSLKEENQYGSSVQALALILTNEGYVSVNRTQKIIYALTNGEVDLSEGYISKLQKRLANKLYDFGDELKHFIIACHLIHWDDTVITVGGNNAIMRVYCSDEATLYYAHMKKNLESIKDDGILISLNESTIVVHDHLKLNYNDAFDFINSECGIHLIRRLTKMKEITDHEWPQAMISLMLAVKNAKDTHASYDLIDVYDDYDEILELGYSINKHDLRNPMKEKEKTMLNDLRAYKEAYLLFARFDEVPFTNNAAENQIRRIKIREKVSGQFTNLKNAENHALILSYIMTGKKNGYNPNQIIIDAIEGHPVSLKEMLEHGSELREEGKL